MRIKMINPAAYIVEGDSGREYTVYYHPRHGRWWCTCPDFAFRRFKDERVKCKHIIFVEKFILETRSGEDVY
ncbi:MAG: SWIM zinc finger family protein [Nitrososphaerota archaeon]